MQSSTYCGQRTDFVTEKQSAEGKLNNYKMIIIPKCDRVEKTTIEALRNYLNNGGKVIMLGEDCLKYDEYGNPYDSAVYSDVVAKSKIIPITWSGLAMTSPTNKEIRDMLWTEYEALGLNKVRLVDTATGETVYDVEWEHAEYNGNIIINVNNYNWNNQVSVAVEVNGQRVSEFTELRGLTKHTGSIELKPYEPVLLQIPVNK